MPKKIITEAMAEIIDSIFPYLPDENIGLAHYVRFNAAVKMAKLAELGYTIQQANKVLRRYFGLEIKAYNNNTGTHYRLVFYRYASIESLKPSRLNCRQDLERCFTTCYAAADCPAAQLARPGVGHRMKKALNTTYIIEGERI